MKEIYQNNSKLHLKHLQEFSGRLRKLQLGEEDQQWRKELEFVRERTKDKIKQVKARIFMEELGRGD